MMDNWDCDFKTDDIDLFLQTFWNSQNCDVFIDESGDMIGHYDRPMIQTATKGRHWGHNCYYMTQRPTMISPSVRTQCRMLFLFVVGRKDAQILAEEYNKPEIADAHLLPPGVCYVVKRHQPVTKLDVFERGKEHDKSMADSGSGCSNTGSFDGRDEKRSEKSITEAQEKEQTEGETGDNRAEYTE